MIANTNVGYLMRFALDLVHTLGPFFDTPISYLDIQSKYKGNFSLHTESRRWKSKFEGSRWRGEDDISLRKLTT